MTSIIFSRRLPIMALAVFFIPVVFTANAGFADAHSASSKVNFSQLYNRTLSDFQSLGSVASQHNQFASHHSNCGSEKNQAWTRTAHKRMNNIQGILKALNKASSGAKHTSVYRDLSNAVHRVKAWGKKIVGHLDTCRKVASQNQAIQRALTAVATDLGISGGY